MQKQGSDRVGSLDEGVSKGNRFHFVPPSPDVRQRVSGGHPTFPSGPPCGTFRRPLPDGATRSMEVRPMQQNRPVVIAVAVILLLAALAFWRSCSY